MAIRFQIPTADLQAAAARVRAVTTLLGSPEPLLKAWGVQTLAEIAENFRVGGRPSWAPLKPSTVTARRTGSSSKPLDSIRLQQSFDYRVEGRGVDIFSTDPNAVFAEFGTRPHDIVAKNAKALAIQTGPYTKAGLGRSRATGRGSFTFAPSGKRTPKRFAGRAGKAVVPFANVIFRQKVHHPGTPPRPILPTEELLVPKLIEAGDAFLAKIIGSGLSA